MPYYEQFVKAAIATFAHMGCLLEGTLSGTVEDSDSGIGIGGATVEAWQDGELVRSSTTLGDGSYQLALQPGSYTIKVGALDHLSQSQPGVSISNGQTTNHDAALESCIFVKGTDWSASNYFPAVSETVAFTGTTTAGDPPITLTWAFGDSGTGNGANVAHAFLAPGMYRVQLTGDNLCSAAQIITAPIFVDVSVLYLPVSMKNSAVP
jgi:PKD repeat protein